jgi:hypothetical protein
VRYHEFARLSANAGGTLNTPNTKSENTTIKL